MMFFKRNRKEIIEKVDKERIESKDCLLDLLRDTNTKIRNISEKSLKTVHKEGVNG